MKTGTAPSRQSIHDVVRLKSILLVDDRPEILESLTLQFRELSDEWTVTTASTGRGALALTRSKAFDIVLIDVLMPGTDGIETLREIKRDPGGPRVIVMTGGGNVVGLESLEVARLMGADATLQKPFAFTTLLRTIHDLLDEEGTE